MIRRIKAPKNFRNRSRESPQFLIFLGPHSHLWRLRWNFAQPSGPTCLSALPSLTWIGATSRPCGVKNLIFGLWVNLIPAVCRYAAILPVITYKWTIMKQSRPSVHVNQSLQPVS